MTTSVVGSCASQSVTFPANGATYESIGSQTDGASKERSVDGGSTWQNATSPTFGSTNAIILPIELLEFKATLKNKIVEINWTTLTELNNDFFTIERSADGILFKSIHVLNGAGNSLSVINYSTIDEEPFNGTTYYRLKQTDFNGSYSYSNIESVYFTNMADFDIYPNPNTSGLLTIRSIKSSKYVLKIINTIGQIVFEKDFDSMINELDLTNFSKGVYTIQINDNNFFVTKKIIYQ